MELYNWINEINTSPQAKLTWPKFLKPYHLITLALSLKKAGENNLELPDELKSYAIRMHLWESIGGQASNTVKENATEEKFLPIHSFSENKRNVNDVVDKLAKIIKKNTSEEIKNSLSACLQEIVNNFFDHANAKKELPCLVAAQSWPKAKLLQVAIADAGIGIRDSLSRNSELHPALNKRNACELASEYGITSKPNQGHSGYGLTLAKDLMKLCGGTFALFSGDEIFWLEQEQSASEKTDCKWNGTLLILEWKMDKELNVGSVYKSWPLPQGFNEDDFFD